MIFSKIKVSNPLEVPLKTVKIIIKKELGILKLSIIQGDDLLLLKYFSKEFNNSKSVKKLNFLSSYFRWIGSVASAKIKHQVLN